MRRLLLVVALLALAGCDASTPPPAPTATGTPEGTAIIGVQTPTTQPTSDVTDYKITLDWASHTSGTITNPGAAPVATLVGIYVGDHPTENPAYQRVAFYFRGGFPSYQVGFVTKVVGEGSGQPIQLAGDAFLQVGFTNARAHDDAGANTVATKPKSPIGLSRVLDYGSAGDFEAHVTYGLGLKATDGSPEVRVGQMKKVDDYIVFVDVKS
jgi:hypothetical protein